MVAALGVVVGARQGAQQTAERAPGLYITMPGASLTRIVPQQVEVEMRGMGTSMLTGGFSRPSAEARIFGPRAETRLPAGNATFQLRLNPPMAMGDPTAMMAAAGSDIPFQVRRVNDIVLMRLTLSDDGKERIAELGRIGGNNPRNKVDLNTNRTAERDYTLETKTPLVAGEYSFTVVPVGGGGPSSFWTFGVD
jgi:hypothetical protein